MKLCLLGPASHLHVRRWARSFAERGYEVHIVSWETAPIERHVHHHALPRLAGRFRLPRQVMRLRRLLAAIGPDVVHAHWLIVYGWLAWLSGFHPRIVTVWGSDAHFLARRTLLARVLSLGALRGADLVTASSRALLAQTRRLGARPERMELVRWGVDLTQFRLRSDDEALRRELGLTGRRVVVNPRGPQVVYGPEVAIAAMQEVRQVCPDAVLVQISDPLHPRHKTLMARIEAAGLGEAVRLVPRMPHEQMPALFSLADIVLSIAAMDSTAISLLEGMACGAFPVVSDIPPNREAIDQQRGFHVPVGDAAALAAALIRALQDPERRRQAAAANRRWIEVHAEATAHLDRMEHLYRQLRGKAAGVPTLATP